VTVPRDDILYALPLPDEMSEDDLATNRKLAADHLERVRLAHGKRCPNCNMRLDDPKLTLHRALDPGVCVTQRNARMEVEVTTEGFVLDTSQLDATCIPKCDPEDE
jgi:hypothetical protein